MKTQGLIAKGDKQSEWETFKALTKVRGPGGVAERRKVAARLLRHYHPEMAGAL